MAGLFYIRNGDRPRLFAGFACSVSVADAPDAKSGRPDWKVGQRWPAFSASRTGDLELISATLSHPWFTLSPFGNVLIA